MSGSFMALLSAFCFAAGNICTRRGVTRIDDAALGGYISVFVAPPLFLLAALASGDLHSIAGFTWKGYLWLGIAGIVHFILGRSSNYWSLKYLGANMASVFQGLNLVCTILLGFFILGEEITRSMALGSLLIILGPALLAWPQSNGNVGAAERNAGKPQLSRKGITAALLAGIFFGTSPLFVKWGLEEGGSALAGAFVSYSGAALILGATMAGKVRRNEIFNMDRQAFLWFVYSGLFVAMAQLLRYTAFKWSPLSVVGPLIGTIPVFLLALSFMVNRKVESFRLNIIAGAVLVVLGTMLLYR